MYKLILKIRRFIQTDKIYLVFLLLLIPILNGCSSKPSESKAREALQLYLNENYGTESIVTIKSFKKVNGIPEEVFGVKCYVMEFEAEVNFFPISRWGKRGDEKLNGYVKFIKTEKGWRAQDVRFDKWRGF
jgi:hypothetical protein